MTGEASAQQGEKPAGVTGSPTGEKVAEEGIAARHTDNVAAAAAADGSVAAATVTTLPYDENAEARPSTQTTASKIVKSFRRLSATFAPKPHLQGHVTQGRIAEQTQQQQQQRHEDKQVAPASEPTATATGGEEAPTATVGDGTVQSASVDPISQTSDPASNGAVHGGAALKHRISSKSRPTVADIKRRLSAPFNTPLVAEDRSNKPVPPLPEATTVVESSAAAPATTSMAAPDVTPAAATEAAPAAPTTPAVKNADDQEKGEKPTKHRLWSGSFKEALRGPLRESKLLHPQDWVRNKSNGQREGTQSSDNLTQGAQRADRKSASAADDRRRKSTSAVRSANVTDGVQGSPDNDRAAAPPHSFFSKLKQTLKDDLGRDFPAGDKSGKTSKKIGTVKVTLNRQGQMSTVERVKESGSDYKKEGKGEQSKKKKRSGTDDDDDSPKGPPAVPTEHAIYSQDVGSGQQNASAAAAAATGGTAGGTAGGAVVTGS